MNRRHAVHAGVIAGVLAFVIAYVAQLFVHVPTLYYLPLAHRWTFHPSGIAMAWYGHTLAALVLGAAAFLVGRAVMLRRTT